MITSYLDDRCKITIDVNNVAVIYTGLIGTLNHCFIAYTLNTVITIESLYIGCLVWYCLKCVSSQEKYCTCVLFSVSQSHVAVSTYENKRRSRVKSSTFLVCTLVNVYTTLLHLHTFTYTLKDNMQGGSIQWPVFNKLSRAHFKKKISTCGLLQIAGIEKGIFFIYRLYDTWRYLKNCENANDLKKVVIPTLKILILFESP